LLVKTPVAIRGSQALEFSLPTTLFRNDSRIADDTGFVPTELGTVLWARSNSPGEADRVIY
jgi:hypothetical protein